MMVVILNKLEIVNFVDFGGKKKKHYCQNPTTREPDLIGLKYTLDMGLFKTS